MGRTWRLQHQTHTLLCWGKPPGGRNDEVDTEIKQEVGVGTDIGEQEGTPTHGAGGAGWFLTGHSLHKPAYISSEHCRGKGELEASGSTSGLLQLDTPRLCFCVCVLHSVAGSFDSQNTDGEGNGWDTPRVELLIIKDNFILIILLSFIFFPISFHFFTLFFSIDPPMYVCIYLHTYLYIYLSTYLYVYLCISIHLSIHPPNHPSMES